MNKYNKLSKEQKRKNQSRSTTNRYTILLGNKCKICNEDNWFKLETHHEVYPTYRCEILEAINNGLIYLVCEKCHRRIHHGA